MTKIRGMSLASFIDACKAGIRTRPSPKHLFVAVADHFEPDWNGASRGKQVERVARWISEYPRLFQPYQDSRGRSPQHSFFYPIEVYDAEHIDQLCQLVRQGYGDIELHLHHDNDCSERLRVTLEEARRTFHDRHGLLTKDDHGEIRYGFIHGNWALDNSHPDGKWCGVNDELTVLMQTGCYADFTMPAAPHPAQTRIINSIYYAVDDPLNPKSHDSGFLADSSKSPPAKSLLMIQGPLSVVVEFQGWSPKVRVENGNLSGSQPPSSNRIPRWLKSCVHVANRPDWLFVKLHTHGANETNASVLLGDAMCRMHEGLRDHARTNDYDFYYVTARQMAQLVKQAELGIESPNFDALSW